MPPPPEELLAEYHELTTIPMSMQKSAVVPRNVESTKALVKTWCGADRSGPANNHQFDPDFVLQSALEGVDHVMPIPTDMPKHPRFKGMWRMSCLPQRWELFFICVI